MNEQTTTTMPGDLASSRAHRVCDFSSLGFGIFFHYGLYSLLEQGEWAFLLRGHKWPAYERLTEKFTADGFDAEEWVDFVKRAQGRYAVFTSRHHEGFSLYDTRGLNQYDAPHSAAGRDLLAEFVEACRRGGIVPIVYHTTGDWWWRGQKTKELSDSDFNDYLDYLY
jgi:alpha-L-fucosidase